MINVLFMHKGGELIRGSEVSLLVLLENLDRTRINPVVLCNRWSFARKLRHLGIDFTVIDWPEMTIDSIVVLQPLKYLRFLFLTHRLIKKKQIDLLYSNGGLPCQIGVVLAKMKGLTTICHIRAPHPKRYAWMWLFKFADRVIFVSEAVHKSMVSKIGFNRTCVIYNAVDDKIFPGPKLARKGLRRKLGIKRTDVVIGQVGSLIPRKGLDVLLRAFAGLSPQHRRLKLVLVGGGNESYRQNLQELAADLGIADQLVFAGETAEPQRFYTEVFDINVLSSRAEAFGRTLIEAAACGLPSVASDSDGMPEVVEDGVTGLLFEKENAQDLQQKLALLINNRGLRRSMGAKGKARVADLFTVKAYVARVQEEILQTSRRPLGHAERSALPAGSAKRTSRKFKTRPRRGQAKRTAAQGQKTRGVSCPSSIDP